MLTERGFQMYFANHEVKKISMIDSVRNEDKKIRMIAA